ncbi:MAG TPA: Fe-Mn family superoxide dismutase [Hyphomonadaceae bacterium]|jgi:Fe-Mn family superoxide dismutase|nr:Fe-Mn family superoxide dismutase [Hyphomonadaceae bacterium]
MDIKLDRRAAMTAVLAGAAIVAAQGAASAQQGGAPAKGYKALPLPFDPKTISGFSENILVSHHTNNYTGAVNRIGAIGGQLAQLDMTTAPGFLVNGLKREELLAMNSMILHEAYFASLGKGGSKAGSGLAKQIEADFGSEKKWRDEYVAMGKALGGGSGWVFLSWSPRAGRLVNQWAADHTMTLADGRVLLALDMYEHAYHMDFGAKAAAYVDAYMGALDWSHANAEFAAISR